VLCRVRTRVSAVRGCKLLLQNNAAIQRKESAAGLIKLRKKIKRKK